MQGSKVVTEMVPCYFRLGVILTQNSGHEFLKKSLNTHKTLNSTDHILHPKSSLEFSSSAAADFFLFVAVKLAALFMLMRSLCV